MDDELEPRALFRSDEISSLPFVPPLPHPQLYAPLHGDIPLEFSFPMTKRGIQSKGNNRQWSRIPNPVSGSSRWLEREEDQPGQNPDPKNIVFSKTILILVLVVVLSRFLTPASALWHTTHSSLCAAPSPACLWFQEVSTHIEGREPPLYVGDYKLTYPKQPIMVD